MTLARPLAPPLTLLLAILFIACPAIGDEPPLGRLFLDPAQRAKLDLQRKLNPLFLPGASDLEANQTLNGEIRSSSGRRTLWINGQASRENAPPARTAIGDTFNPATGERESLLRGGSISPGNPGR